MHILLDILQKDLADDTTAFKLAGKQVDNPFMDKSTSRNEQFYQRLCSDILLAFFKKSIFEKKFLKVNCPLINPFSKIVHANFMAVNVSSEDSSPLNLSAHLIVWV